MAGAHITLALPRPWALKKGQAIERLYANRFPSP